MDVYFLDQGQRFVWDSEKASSRVRKHGVSFDSACQVFFDPFVASSRRVPMKKHAIGHSASQRIGLFCLWFTPGVKKTRSALCPLAKPLHRNGDGVKTASERIRQRLRKDRQMTAISLRLPDDVIEDLKEIAPSLGFSGYQPLIRAYIGQGLRKDQARMENSQLQLLTESLRKHGIADEIISSVIADAQPKSA